MQFAKQLAIQSPKYNIHYLAAKKSLISFGNSKIIKANWQQQLLPHLGKKYDLWHSLHQFPRHLPHKATKHILTIHDLNFIIEKSPVKANKYLKRLQKNIDKADCITTISEFSKKQITKHLDLSSKPVHVIYNGVDSGVDMLAKKPSLVAETPFFCSIGIFNSKKNFEVLLPIMKKFPDIKLYLAGNNNTTYGKFIISEIQRLSLENQVILLGKISDQEKNWLYKHMSALLFPSLAEGFGMPVIEAMHHGKPVFLSKHTSLPEIGGKHAFYFSDFEPENMAKQINSGLKEYQDNPMLAEQIANHAKQFSWQNCIKQYVTLYETQLT